MKPGLTGLAVAVALFSHPVSAEDTKALPEIRVEDSLLADPSTLSVEPGAISTGMPADTGEWLRSLPGVSGRRLGGHGIDPVVRGQSDTRINVLLDGAYVHGGCPNRMDPPTSYAPLESYDRVTLLRGAQTVRYGGGGSGGTLLLERYTEPFTDAAPARVAASGAYGSNGERRSLFVDIANGNDLGFIRALTGYAKSNDYEDGNGEKVRTAYKEKGASLIVGVTPDSDTRLEASVEAIRGEDMLFAGRMDAPQSDSDTWRLKFEHQGMGGFFNQVRGELYYSAVDHVMDNFSLRSPPMMKMEVPSTSDTTGGRVSFDHIAANGSLWTLGVDMQNNDRDATRFAGPTLAQVNSLLWPDVQTDQAGVFAEMAMDLSDVRRMSAGLRYDRVDAKAGDASQALSGMLLGPDQLYTLYYGDDADDVTENNVGGFVKFEQDLDRYPVTLFAGISRSVRTADATERFIAANSPTDPTLRWVGNPQLDPEQHHQLELGANASPGRWQMRASLYIDEVSDFILRDTARGQDGVQLADGATVYRNVDARLYGGELELQRRWTRQLSSSFSLSRVYGRNTDDDSSLAQIPPLEFTGAVDYRRDTWSVGGRVRGADRQDRVDVNPDSGSGLDTGETGGWAALDLYGERSVNRLLTLKAGVDNLFDKNYAEHLNRANDFDPVQVQINEPGRSLWLKADARF